MKEKKEVKLIKCNECNKEFRPNIFGRHVKKHGYKNRREYNVYYKLEPSDEELLANGMISCEICGFISHSLPNHIMYTHKMSLNEYKEKYNTPVRSQKFLDDQSKRITGEKNPAYNHRGKFSPFSKKFIYADETNIDKLLEKANNTRKENNNETTKIEYWLKKTNGNLEEAQKLLSNRQSTFSLEKCIEKHGEEIGKEIWSSRQEKWHKSYKKSNFSKISQDLFWNIIPHLKSLDDIYFAQLSKNKTLDDSGNNNEYRLKLDRVFLPDFIDIKNKKIIEFDGSYWHGEVRGKTRLSAEEKDQIMIQNGYDVLHINEHDYTTDKINQIDKCIKFLIV